MTHQVTVYHPPGPINGRDRSVPSIFLGGTIDMGSSEDWQNDFCYTFANKAILKEKSFNLFNPRRPDWDSSWVQDIKNSNFYQQVDWEMNALQQADWIVMHLAPNSASPISLLEIGLYAHAGSKLLVHCPEGFHRKGNVDIVCAKNDIRQFESLDEIIEFLVR